MAAVVFDIPTFRSQYPQLMQITDAQLEQAFNNACLLLDNTDNSIVPYDPPQQMERETLLYLLTCHLGELALRGVGAVGNMTAAAEGSVNVTFSLPSITNAEWYLQTQSGFTFWQATLKYRQGRYYV